MLRQLPTNVSSKRNGMFQADIQIYFHNSSVLIDNVSNNDDVSSLANSAYSIVLTDNVAEFMNHTDVIQLYVF